MGWGVFSKEIVIFSGGADCVDLTHRENERVKLPSAYNTVGVIIIVRDRSNQVA